jgi:hypothetical protein
MSRIYKVTLTATAPSVRYVRADTAGRALRAVTGDLYSVEPVSASDLYEATKTPGFAVLETAGGE